MNEQPPTQPMRFIDIGRGEYATRMQQAFEDAAATAKERGCPITISSAITITPPPGKERMGEIAFKIQVSNPPVKSHKYITEISESGSIVADGTDAAQMLQITFDEQLRMPNRSKASA